MPREAAEEPELIVLPHGGSDALREGGSRRRPSCLEEPAIDFDPFPLTVRPIETRPGVSLTACAEIGTNGRVVRAWLLNGTNFPAADRAVLERLDTIRFDPASKAGKAVGSRHVILIGKPPPSGLVL